MALLLNYHKMQNQETNKNPLRIGLFGFGCVGQGLYNVLSKTRGIHATVQKICIKHPSKTRSLPQEYFTTDANEILNSPDIDVVVELIDDADAAFNIVSTALRNGKAVVTANKKMLAEHLQSLYELQQQCQRPLLYEAACCGSIPIIRNLEEYYDNDLLRSISGIFNGSTNYILTQMWEQGKSYQQALSEAQAKGFAESNPLLDVEGYDAKFKLCIALLHAFGIFVNPDDIFNFGIQQLNQRDVEYARQNHKKIKLVVHGQKLEQDGVTAFVMPTFVTSESPLIHVHNEYNGIILESAFADRQFFMGKGAGSNPTGSAVLSDVSALTYNYKYEYKKLLQDNNSAYSQEVRLELYIRYDHPSHLRWEDLDIVHQKFESADYNYIIAEISLGKLFQEHWRKNPNISLIINKVLIDGSTESPFEIKAEEEAAVA